MPLHRQATLIGGDGFVGRRLQARLRRDGWVCWVPGRDDPALLERDLGRVFHCAGLTADYASRPFDTVEAHVSLLARVLRRGRFESLLYLSSTRLYDGLGDVEAREDEPLALSPHEPRHLYDLSKAMGESLCRTAGAGRARIARLACVWDDAPDAEGFLPGVLRRVRDARACGARSVEFDTSARAARDYVHVDDVVDALLLIAAGGARATYNVAQGANLDNATLFRRLSATTGLAVGAAHARDVPAAPRVSIARLADEFGWRPEPTIERVARTMGAECACPGW